MASIEESKAVARRWFELVTEHRIEAICAMTDGAWTIHGGPPGLPRGPDGGRELFPILNWSDDLAPSPRWQFSHPR